MYRKGDTEGVLKMLEASAPALPHYARQAVLKLAQSKPSFYPMPSWTHLSQLHGPEASVKKSSGQASFAACLCFTC